MHYFNEPTTMGDTPWTWQSELNPTNWSNPGTGPGHDNFDPIGNDDGSYSGDMNTASGVPEKTFFDEFKEWAAKAENQTMLMLGGAVLVILLTKKR